VEVIGTKTAVIIKKVSALLTDKGNINAWQKLKILWQRHGRKEIVERLKRKNKK